MMVTKKELSRLQKHPELFRTKGVEEDFWDEIFRICDHVVEKIMSGAKGQYEDEEDLYAKAVEMMNDEVLPRRDIQRKPWEQFLNNRAPGSGADLSQFREGGSVQLMPMASVRIVLELQDETAAAAEDIEAVCILPLPLSGMMECKVDEG